jgi:hypothetical protein
VPPTPPSHEQALKKDDASSPLVKILKNLFLNPCYVLLLIAYAINQGVVNSMSTFLNQMILPYFKVQATKPRITRFVLSTTIRKGENH